ncbi:methyltransferase domain-containing protein [Nonomuraea sp. H19]|uniref:methyltransferase domain-containing protein n=1 Tax=Nonomuraea sp. H19 TaxID=3452206 RepID=UPI003F888BA8
MHTFAVARAVRGIEPLVATEIRRSRLGVVRALRHREVWFEATDSAGLLDLRTADDVLLAAAVVDGIGHDRAALRRLAGAVRELDARGLARLRGGVPNADAPGRPGAGRGKGGPDSGLEVSASFVGRRNYTRFDIEDAVGVELARPLRLRYHSRRDGGTPPAGAMSWRVTIEGDQAVIALRVAGRPMHRRPYKRASVAGTLHPPLAAAMAVLARLDGGRTVLDPCCGAGTTLIEAYALMTGARADSGARVRPDRAPRAPVEPRLLGLDHNPAAIEAAAGNARAACAVRRSPFGWAVADAGRIPVPTGSVDRVLVNPPWDRQVPPSGLLRRDPGLLWREVRRVLAADGLAVALVHDEIPRGFAVERAIRVSLSGRHPLIAVLTEGR